MQDPLPRFPTQAELAESRRKQHEEEQKLLEENPPPTIGVLARPVAQSCADTQAHEGA
jgi:hypothetical protein